MHWLSIVLSSLAHLPLALGYIRSQAFEQPLPPEKEQQLFDLMHKDDDAARCIENEILMHLRKIKKHKQETSLNDQMGQDVEGGTLTLADILPSNDLPVDDQLAFKELTHHLYKWMHLLDEREVEIIQHRYGLFHHSPLTQVALAEKLGISRSYVSRIEKRALIKLYQVLKSKK
ncbi:sigma-70 family RNA polymerase sigma factor [Chryseomicrobium palamuruense]